MYILLYHPNNVKNNYNMSVQDLAMRWIIQLQILVEALGFLLLPCPEWLQDPPSFKCNWYKGLIPQG